MHAIMNCFKGLTENDFVTERKIYSTLKPSNCGKCDPKISADCPSYSKDV
jgi:hypothetical protein